MPSHDILDKLFTVEKKAEEIVGAAQDESDRRIAQAKEESEAVFKAAYEKRVAELSLVLEDSMRQTDVEFKGDLASFRARLEAAGKNPSAFDSLCDSLLFRKA